jgi:hypothetical protein
MTSMMNEFPLKIFMAGRRSSIETYNLESFSVVIYIQFLPRTSETHVLYSTVYELFTCFVDYIKRTIHEITVLSVWQVAQH